MLLRNISNNQSINIPYKVSVNGNVLTNLRYGANDIIGSVICQGGDLNIPVTIGADHLPYNTGAGTYKDTLLFNFEY